MERPIFQVADESHVAVLLPLVRDYHDFEQIVLSDQQRLDAVLPLLVPHSKLGRVWLILISGKVVGYATLCFGYSIELGAVMHLLMNYLSLRNFEVKVSVDKL